MVWMRERSGRSGRRRGSQKPGTTTLRDGATPSSAAIAGRSPAAIDKSMPATAAISHNDRARGLAWAYAGIGHRIDRDSILRSPALERHRVKSTRLRSNSLVEHDLFGKPASTFPDHALAGP